MDNPKELTHISLCAGYGGIDLGLKRVFPNMRTVAFSEIEAYAVANLVAKMEAGLLDIAPVWTDLKTFPFGKFRGKVDILSGGFPCQPFSTSGLRRGDGDPRHLFPFIRKGIISVKPSLVFFENVEGLISAKLGENNRDEKGTPVLLHVLRELERLGYRAEASLFTAAECGAPHQRRRVFILGAKKGITLKLTPFQSFDVWPAYRRQNQKEWEPPRYFEMDHSTCRRPENHEQKKSGEKNRNESSRQSSTADLSRNSFLSRHFKSSMDRNIDGTTNRLGIGDLYKSYCDKEGELKLLGNGVVPATAERAFRVLWERLAGKKNP